MLDLVWDMETGDPDDFLTLIWLLGHPSIHLKAVTVTPGSPEQVGVVRYALSLFHADIPVGSFLYDETWENPRTWEASKGLRKSHVSQWHYKTFGNIPLSLDAQPGWQVLHEACDAQTTLLTGGPLKNLGAALSRAKGDASIFEVGRLVAQGGFAGEGVVPPEKQLDKFKGMTFCPTWNLCGDPHSALMALTSPNIHARYFVSKNVCHRVYYNKPLHSLLKPIRTTNPALEMIWDAMEQYLRKKSQGKKFHDPLAACCAVDPSIATWAEVELMYEQGKWGSQLAEETNTWIITDLDDEAFIETLFMQNLPA